jgi:hypothetical protein
MSDKKTLLNRLEPEGFIDAFACEPPENFSSLRFKTPQGDFYGFIAELDLFTTVSENLKTLRQRYERWVPPFIKNFFRQRVLFIGTPISEYAILPASLEPDALKTLWLSEFGKTNAAFLIVKDLPKQSPLLTDEENRFSERMLAFLEQQGFLILSGQALGYVNIDFNSREEYLKKFHSRRRNNLKRKLKKFSMVSVQEIRTGDPALDNSLCEALYSLYLNVYENSYIHFEKQRFPFFKKVLTDPDNQGVIFLFYTAEKLIGFAMCFNYQNMLVEKYIGSLYPDSREHNLYYLSWFYKLDFCIRHRLRRMIVGCTDPEIKAYLGAEFTQSYHAVYIPNPVLRWLGRKIRVLFESDRKTLEKLQQEEVIIVNRPDLSETVRQSPRPAANIPETVP